MTKGRRSNFSRRSFTKAIAAVSFAALIPKRASAAEFDYKLGTGQDPTHPNNLRMQEALNRIREKSAGRLDIKLFPANQLGSDTDLLGQLRNGGIEFQLLSTSILAVFVPIAGILNTAYAFTDYNVVWNALDGGLAVTFSRKLKRTGWSADSGSGTTVSGRSHRVRAISAPLRISRDSKYGCRRRRC